MGLAVAREIAHHLGGSIQFETKVGVGSRFLVDVPLHAVAVTTPTAA
jgi:signal transduction histidine kinase